LACCFLKQSQARLIPFMYTQGTRMAGRQTTNSSVFNWMCTYSIEVKICLLK
jgi:hypothetical protein